MENIAILTGGLSSEKHISIQSAKTIYHNIDRLKYNAYIVNCLDTKTFNVIIDQKTIQIELKDFTFQLNGNKIQFNKVFVMIHGAPGEDGQLCDYFDSIDIPYTCSNKKVSELTFNKYKCNKFLRKKGYNVPRSQIFKNTLRIAFPCIVKPSSAGSSFGISLVNSLKELHIAVRHARTYDKQVLVENFVQGREFTCGVYMVNNNIEALPITEIISANDFFDYDAKYNNKSKEITPAKISVKLKKKIQYTSIKIFQELRLSSFVRIDFIISNEVPYVIEINTIPGFSEKSIFPQMLNHAQIKLSEFITQQLINLNN